MSNLIEFLPLCFSSFCRYGLLGKKFKDRFGHTGNSVLSGFVGLRKPENRGVSYSLTEEFVSVYRMHSLLPDKLLLRDTLSTPGMNKSPPLLQEYDFNFSDTYVSNLIYSL